MPPTWAPNAHVALVRAAEVAKRDSAVTRPKGSLACPKHWRKDRPMIHRHVTVSDAADVEAEAEAERILGINDRRRRLRGRPVPLRERRGGNWPIGVQHAPDHVPPTGQTVRPNKCTLTSTSPTPLRRTNKPRRSRSGFSKPHPIWAAGRPPGLRRPGRSPAFASDGATRPTRPSPPSSPRGAADGHRQAPKG